MKLLIVIPSFYPATIYGGPIFSTLFTCKALAKLPQLKVKVSTTNTNMHSKLNVKTGKWITFEESLYVKYYNETIVDKFSIALYANIWHDIKSADIVHIQAIFNTPTPWALLLAVLMKKPVLLSPRGSLGLWCVDHGNRFKKFWLKYLIAPFSKGIIWHATAEQEKGEILTIFPNANVKIIPNGIDYESYQVTNFLTKKEFCEKYIHRSLEPDNIIISMGRLQKKKGFDILIDTFSEVLHVKPNAMLFIAGDDEGEQATLLNQIGSLQLQDKVFLLGSVSEQDKVDFFANADLFVLPSHNENFGNVYLESLAAGTPIVASKNTPWSIVEISNCGRWVENNIKDTAEAMLYLLSQDRKQLKINSKKLAASYGWKAIAEQFHNVYKSMEKK